MTTLKIIDEKNPNSNDVQALNNGIAEHTKQKRKMKPLDFFSFFIRDQKLWVVVLATICMDIFNKN